MCRCGFYRRTHTRFRAIRRVLPRAKLGVYRVRLRTFSQKRSRKRRPPTPRVKACLGIYGMGVTQQTQGVQNVQMICNLLLLRGNIGKPGNSSRPRSLQRAGQRTVGITEKPELAPR